MKSLKILSLVSSRAHPNHFGLISEIKDLEKARKESEDPLSESESRKYQRKPNETKMIQLRFFEICIGTETIEVFLEERRDYYLTSNTKALKPYIVGNHLVFLIQLEEDPTKPLAPKEEIRTFLITNSYDLIEEKIYQ
jgi:hypothetical protein